MIYPIVRSEQYSFRSFRGELFVPLSVLIVFLPATEMSLSSLVGCHLQELELGRLVSLVVISFPTLGLPGCFLGIEKDSKFRLLES